MLDLSLPKYVHAVERLRDDVIVWLSSVRPDGRPHSVAVWFLLDGDSILVFSKPENQKVRNLRQNPNVVLALDNTDLGEDVITIEGSAELLTDASITTSMPAYLAKYGERMAGLFADPAKMAKEYSQAIRITPTRAHIIS